MRINDFFNDMEISENDKIYAQKAIAAKGLEKHISIKEYLLSWREKGYCRYSEVATTYRYDKRIRNVLYKYISYLEEFFRANIQDNYYNKVEQEFWISQLKELLIKYNQNLNDALENLSFSHLLKQMEKLPQEIKDVCISIKSYVNQNIKALIELRNAVMHNKFLVLYKGLKFCYVNGVDSEKNNGLKANIINLANFLPTGAKEQYVLDINDCRKQKNNKGKTRWDLPTQITVMLP